VDNGYGGVLAGFAGASVIVFVLMLVVFGAIAALCIWLVYTVIWRAVRRGLREYYNPGVKQNVSRPSGSRSPTAPIQRGPRDW
jgi:hypothetical protein